MKNKIGKIYSLIHLLLWNLKNNKDLIEISNSDEADHLAALLTRMLTDTGFRWAMEDFYSEIKNAIESKMDDKKIMNDIISAYLKIKDKRKRVGLQ